MELNIIKAIQSIRNGFFDAFFEGVTILGEEMVFILLFSIAYWCYNKRESIKFIFIFLLSTVLNLSLKEIINRDRPIGLEGVFSLREQTATGQSMPSGHTQGATTFYYYIMRYFNKKWLWIVGSIIIGLVGVSRVYLGVHWPTDVLVAIVLGIGMVYLGSWIFKEIKEYMMYVMIIVANTALILFFSEDLLTVTALVTGASIGLIVETRWVNFSEKARLKTQIIKVLIGILGVVVIKEGIKLFTPDIYLVDYIRYTLLGLWVSAGAPYFFKFLRKKA